MNELLKRAKEFYLFHDEMDAMYINFKKELEKEINENRFDEVIAYVLQIKAITERTCTMFLLELSVSNEKFMYKTPVIRLTEKQKECIASFVQKYNKKEVKYNEEHEFFYGKIIPKLIEEKKDDAFSKIYKFMPTTMEKFELYQRNRQLLIN